MSSDCDETKPQTLHGCDKRHRKPGWLVWLVVLLISLMGVLIGAMGLSAINGASAEAAAREATGAASKVASTLVIHEKIQKKTEDQWIERFAALDEKWSDRETQRDDLTESKMKTVRDLIHNVIDEQKDQRALIIRGLDSRDSTP